jgi:hypothetical protein
MSESTKKETEDTKDIVAILLDNVRKYSLYGIFPLSACRRKGGFGKVFVEPCRFCVHLDVQGGII